MWWKLFLSLHPQFLSLSLTRPLYIHCTGWLDLPYHLGATPGPAGAGGGGLEAWGTHPTNAPCQGKDLIFQFFNCL